MECTFKRSIAVDWMSPTGGTGDLAERQVDRAELSMGRHVFSRVTEQSRRARQDLAHDRLIFRGEAVSLSGRHAPSGPAFTWCAGVPADRAGRRRDPICDARNRTARFVLEA